MALQPAKQLNVPTVLYCGVIYKFALVRGEVSSPAHRLLAILVPPIKY